MKIVFPILFALGASLAFAADPENDPGDMFVKVYTLMKDAGRLEKKGAIPEAIQKYKEAGTILDAIRVRFPQWRPEIIEFRRRRLLELLNKLAPVADGVQSVERFSFSGGKHSPGSGKVRQLTCGALRRGAEGLWRGPEHYGGQETRFGQPRSTPGLSKRRLASPGGLRPSANSFFPSPQDSVPHKTGFS